MNNISNNDTKVIIPDQIITKNKCILQHGVLNDRIYVMDIGDLTATELLSWIHTIQAEQNYSRILAKIPESQAEPFLQDQFFVEAIVPKMFHNEAGLFLSKFPNETRRLEPTQSERELILALVQKKAQETKPQTPSLPPAFQIQTLQPEHCKTIAQLLAQTFPSYPFPVHDPAFILEEMKSHTQYYGIFENEVLVALASAECNFERGYAECTDFATNPDYRGKGLAQFLLHYMETKLDEQNIHTHYTIARALQTGMNLVFARAGWNYVGSLVNSTQIGGQLESMNIWQTCKS
jgi:beta-lysine N6-acetyltransferase